MKQKIVIFLLSIFMLVTGCSNTFTYNNDGGGGI